MKINGFPVQSPLSKPADSSAKNAVDNFSGMVKGFIEDVNKDQVNSRKSTTEFVQGGDVEIHEVMIAGQKAKTSLELLMEIRNKTIDMYKELSRIQV